MAVLPFLTAESDVKYAGRARARAARVHASLGLAAAASQEPGCVGAQLRSFALTSSLAWVRDARVQGGVHQEQDARERGGAHEGRAQLGGGCERVQDALHVAHGGLRRAMSGPPGAAGSLAES